MKYITFEFLKEQLKIKTTVSVLSVFAVTGILIPFLPLVYFRSINTNAIISFFFLLIVFGIPFGYFMGIRNILKKKKINNCIQNHKFYITENVVTQKMVIPSHHDEDNLELYGRLYVESYGEKKECNVVVDVTTYKKVKEGDNCILVFVEVEESPVLVFAGNEYMIHYDLQNYVKHS